MAIKKLQLNLRERSRLPLILREIEIIANSSHRNIVKYVESFTVGEELWVCFYLILWDCEASQRTEFR